MPASPAHPLVRSHLRAHPEGVWSQASRTSAVSILNRFTVWLDARGVAVIDTTADDCRDYLNERATRIAGSTAHKEYQHLRWFFAFLVAEEHLDDRRKFGPMHTVAAPKVSKPDPSRVRRVSTDDYERLMSSFRKRPLVDCRDAALCSLMYWSGLRRSEVVRMDRTDIDLQRRTGRVLGKNGDWRTFPLMAETVDWLTRYLDRRDTAGDTATALFASCGVWTTADNETSGRMLPNAVTLMLARRCEPLGLNLSAHMFRRAMAIESKRRGVSDSSTMSAAGWKDPRMFMRYISEEHEQLAVAEFHANDPTDRRRGRSGYRAMRVA